MHRLRHIIDPTEPRAAASKRIASIIVRTYDGNGVAGKLGNPKADEIDFMFQLGAKETTVATVYMHSGQVWLRPVPKNRYGLTWATVVATFVYALTPKRCHGNFQFTHVGPDEDLHIAIPTEFGKLDRIPYEEWTSAFAWCAMLHRNLDTLRENAQ